MSKAYESFVSDVLDTIAEMRSTGDFDENTLETLEWKLSPPTGEDLDKCRLGCECETTISLTAGELDTLRGYLGEILATDANSDIHAIYTQLLED